MTFARPDGVSKELVVETAIEQLRFQPLHTLSLETVAAALGVRRGTVGMHFPTKEALLLGVMEAWNDRWLTPLAPIATERGAIAFLRAVIEANLTDPTHIHLLIGAADIAAYPRSPMATQFREQYLALLALIVDALRRDLDTGPESGQEDPTHAVAELIALYERLSLQSLMRPGIDLLATFYLGVAGLCHNWAEAACDDGAAARTAVSPGPRKLLAERRERAR